MRFPERVKIAHQPSPRFQPRNLSPQPAPPDPPRDQVVLSEPRSAEAWAAFRANPTQQPARLKATEADGTLHLEHVRWGFDETGASPSDWKPIWADARIQPKDIENIYLTSEPLPPGGAISHAEAVLEFKKPVCSSDGHRDRRMVVSLEAWKRPGETYNLVKGMKKTYGTVITVGSFGDRVQSTCRRMGRKMILYKLNLNDEQKQEFVRNSLVDATSDRSGDWYNTLTNSCYTFQVEELNKVLEKDRQIPQNLPGTNIPRFFSAFPSPAAFHLDRRGLISKDKPLEIPSDAAMWPNKVNMHDSFGARLTQKPGFLPLFTAGAAAAAGAVGYAAGIPGLVAGGAIGGLLGFELGHRFEVLNSVVQAEPSQFLPGAPTNLKSLEEVVPER